MLEEKAFRPMVLTFGVERIVSPSTGRAACATSGRPGGLRTGWTAFLKFHGGCSARMVRRELLAGGWRLALGHVQSLRQGEGAAV